MVLVEMHNENIKKIFDFMKSFLILDIHLDCEAKIAKFVGTLNSIRHIFGISIFFNATPAFSNTVLSRVRLDFPDLEIVCVKKIIGWDHFMLSSEAFIKDSKLVIFVERFEDMMAVPIQVVPSKDYITDAYSFQILFNTQSEIENLTPGSLQAEGVNARHVYTLVTPNSSRAPAPGLNRYPHPKPFYYTLAKIKARPGIVFFRFLCSEVSTGISASLPCPSLTRDWLNEKGSTKS
ncbi:hypothetical protein VNO77_14641 [Canavalia gladiata]|uniref:Uncharacterized protein n=1 Tax=Canavalia gladiata TaxID=3824 RepID=A0AAN9LYX5_CANGL